MVGSLREARAARFREIDLYPVTCEALSAGRTNLDILRAVIDGGAKIIQLREKECSTLELYQMAERFREETARAGVLLIINDRVDIALAIGADGVHLGQDDLPIPAARRLAPDLILGASTHSLEEALRAQGEGADYVNIGPIFATGTKEGISEFLGPEAIGRIAPSLSIPFTVMGGIKPSNLDEVLEQGARRIAVVTAVTRAPDVSRAVEGLRQRITGFRR
ncbi:MAG: thiamine phosphate synthase [Syntrophobacteraceae bacterium]